MNLNNTRKQGQQLIQRLSSVWLLAIVMLLGGAASAVESNLVSQAAAPLPPPQVTGLPLVEVPVAAPGDTLAVIITGDGGWADIDRNLAAGLTRKGIPVVGWDSLHYLWTARKPEEVGADLERVLKHYLNARQRRRVILVGYSPGAEILPIMATRLAPDLKERIDLVAILAPGPTAHLEFHVGDWVGIGGTGGIALKTEIEHLGATPVLSIYGSDETGDSLCPLLHGEKLQVVGLPGGHHFGGDYAALLRHILQAAGRNGQQARIRVDMYPGLELEGVVQSMSLASGAAFSLLPPENATGNWVKVTQRFPVRLQVTGGGDTARPLRLGASCSVQIDTTADSITGGK